MCDLCSFIDYFVSVDIHFHVKLGLELSKLNLKVRMTKNKRGQYFPLYSTFNL